jgi:hypothetical protein
MARTDSDEKLWRYPALVRLWSWTLIGVGVALLVASSGVRAGSDPGLTGEWIGTLLATTTGTGVLFVPLLRMWLKRTAPSQFLPRAKKLSGSRRLEAGPADWRRWGLFTGGFLLFGSFFVLLFLVGVLRDSGPGGIAEGVVVGLVVAWGAVSHADARAIERTEAREGRRYFAAGHRPTAAGNKLVWVPTDRS